MASLILGASILTYNKIKDVRAKRREKKRWRETSYAELERETEERLASEKLRRTQSQSQGEGEARQGMGNDRVRVEDAERKASYDSERRSREDKG